MNLCTSGKSQVVTSGKSSSHGFFFFLEVCKVKNMGLCPWKLHLYLQSEGIESFMVEGGRRPCRRLTAVPTPSFHLSNVAFLGAVLSLARHPVSLQIPPLRKILVHSLN